MVSIGFVPLEQSHLLNRIMALKEEGLFIEFLAVRLGGTLQWRAFVAVGVLGAFTTFSTFSLDAVVLYERGQLLAAGAYLAASVSLSILALFAGLWALRTVLT